MSMVLIVYTMNASHLTTTDYMYILYVLLYGSEGTDRWKVDTKT